MRSVLVTRIIPRMLGGAVLLGMLTAATCQGDVIVELADLPKSTCVLFFPANVAPGGAEGDVLQLANKNNVNDFIQCRLSKTTPVDPDFLSEQLVTVSPVDAEGHGFISPPGGPFAPAF